MQNLFKVLSYLIFLFCLGCAHVATRPSMDEMKAKAEKGDPVAQLGMGAFYDQGSGYPPDFSQAARWYRASAEQGNAEAQNSLGSMYQFGQGVPRDFSQAMYWYKKAADQGLPKALTSLGYLYDLGLGTPEDNKRAVGFYVDAAEKGDIRAMQNLGIVYAKGEEGISKNIVEACKWFDLARFYTQSSNDMQLKWNVRRLLEEAKKEMTAAQIEKAQALSQEWDKAHKKK
jgi:TPR repeat protein